MRAYAKAIQASLAARAIWEPGAAVLPGDYGVVQEGCFLRLGTVSEFGIKLREFDVAHEGRFEFSRGLSAGQRISATTRVDWAGEAVGSLEWAGGAGVFLGAPKSSVLSLVDLGRIVREALAPGRERWKFSWRLVRQVRTVTSGVVVYGGDSAAAGALSVASDIPASQGAATASVRRTDGFQLVCRDVGGAIYAHTVRLRPWLAHGSAPLDNDLWYDDDLDDE